MTIAVIKTGGKQYKVTEGQLLKIEKIKGEVGEQVTFDKVLLIASEDGKELELGTPYVDKAVFGEILEQSRDKKIRVVKYKAKIRYHKVYGHRQAFTKVKITGIGAVAEEQKTTTEKKVTPKKNVVKKTSVK